MKHWVALMGFGVRMQLSVGHIKIALGHAILPQLARAHPPHALHGGCENQSPAGNLGVEHEISVEPVVDTTLVVVVVTDVAVVYWFAVNYIAHWVVEHHGVGVG